MRHLVEFRRHVLRIKEHEGLRFAAGSLRFGVGIAAVKRGSKGPDPNGLGQSLMSDEKSEQSAPLRLRGMCAMILVAININAQSAPKAQGRPSLIWVRAVLPMIGRAPLAIAKKPHGVRDWKRVGANVIGALRAEIVISIGLRNAKIDADLLHLWAMQDLLPQRPKRPMIVLDNAIFRHTNRARGCWTSQIVCLHPARI